MTNQLTSTDLDTTKTTHPPPQTVSSAPPQTDRPRDRLRWTLIAGGAGLAVAAAVAISNLGADPAEPASPAVEQRPAYLVIQNEIDAALAERESPAVTQPPAYLVIQNEIDAALAERDPARSVSTGG